jgi:hypothetical protein
VREKRVVLLDAGIDEIAHGEKIDAVSLFAPPFNFVNVRNELGQRVGKQAVELEDMVRHGGVLPFVGGADGSWPQSARKSTCIMKILYLHGWNSVVGGVKPTYLKSHGHEVIEPALEHDDFQAALKTAQAAFDQHQPEVVVGSSRGGAVAVNLESGAARLVLICPAWKKWGTVKTTKPGTLILHSRADDVVPFEDSVELLSKSGLSETSLIEVGQDHRLADPEPLEALGRAVRETRPDSDS